MLLEHFPEASICHVRRNFNVVAHNLAKQALQLEEESTWMGEPEKFPPRLIRMVFGCKIDECRYQSPRLAFFLEGGEWTITKVFEGSYSTKLRLRRVGGQADVNIN